MLSTASSWTCRSRRRLALPEPVSVSRTACAMPAKFALISSGPRRKSRKFSASDPIAAVPNAGKISLGADLRRRSQTNGLQISPEQGFSKAPQGALQGSRTISFSRDVKLVSEGISNQSICKRQKYDLQTSRDTKKHAHILVDFMQERLFAIGYHGCQIGVYLKFIFF